MSICRLGRTLVWPALLALVAPLFLACTYDNHHDCEHDGYCEPGPTPTPTPTVVVPSSRIDTGATVTDIEPGRGAGLFVEYQAGGTWHLFAACDTLDSKYRCLWDVIVSTETSLALHDFGGEDLEADDYLDFDSSRSVRFVADNDYDFDGFFVETTPSAKLRVDVYLDEQPAPAYIYWVGDGGLHQGAPSNPIDLIPNAP